MVGSAVAFTSMHAGPSISNPLHVLLPVQVQYGIERIRTSMRHVYLLAQGGTAVGTGLNTFQGELSGCRG